MRMTAPEMQGRGTEIALQGEAHQDWGADEVGMSRLAVERETGQVVWDQGDR